MEIQQRKSEHILLYSLMGLISLIYVVNVIYFKGSFESGDGLRHYQMSRYSWNHPHLLLDLWAKPFFTLVTSPFSQFGLTGIKIFNIICSLIIFKLLFDISKILSIPRAPVVPIFCAFGYYYFFGINGGYTEPFFALLIVVTIYYYLKEKYLWSTILISFLPFVRSEGYLLLPLFFIVLFFRKKYKIIPFLFSGIFIYTIIGYIVFNDIFWLANRNPYDGHMAPYYGSGPLNHFFKIYDYIWGKPLTLLLVAGIILAIIRLIIPGYLKRKYALEEYILIYGCVFTYFICHVIFWWKGLFNSLGLSRVMMAIIPLSSIICLRGLNFLLSPLYKYKTISTIAVVLISAIIIIYPFTTEKFPLRLEPEEELVYEMKNWYDTSEYKNKHQIKYFLQPSIPEFLSFDPFDTKQSGELWGLYSTMKRWGSEAVPQGTLIFWDSHYGPNEAALPLEKLMNDQRFRLIKRFFPKNEFKTLGGHSFEIAVFEKLKRTEKATEKFSEKTYDFENQEELLNSHNLTDSIASSGKMSCKLNEQIEYSTTVVEKTYSLINLNEIECISLELNAYSKNEFEALAILSLHSGDNQSVWLSAPISYSGSNTNQWKLLHAQWKLNSKELINSETFRIYIWNKYKKSFYVDDFTIKSLKRCR
jgi:hypothetical protein